MSNRRPGCSFNLCNFTFVNGKGCAMPATSSGFCVSHTIKRSRATHREDELTGLFRMTGNAGYFSHLDINHALGVLFDALGDNHISTRRAATLAYIANLLIRTQAGTRHEADHYDDDLDAQERVLQAKFPDIFGEPGTPFIPGPDPDEEESEIPQQGPDLETQPAAKAVATQNSTEERSTTSIAAQPTTEAIPIKVTPATDALESQSDKPAQEIETAEANKTTQEETAEENRIDLQPDEDPEYPDATAIQIQEMKVAELVLQQLTGHARRRRRR
jgi:hypothetical protein